MRIALTIYGLYKILGGSEKSLIELANAMHARGHEIFIVIAESGISCSDKTVYPLDPQIEIRNIIHFRESLEKKPAKIQSKLDTIFQKLYADSSIKQITKLLPGRDRRDWLRRYNWLIAGYRHELDDINPDVVVSFLPSSFTYVACALKNTGIPLIVANRNDPRRDYSEGRYPDDSYDVKMRKKATEDAAVNLVQLEEFIRFFPKKIRKKTIVIPNPVEILEETPGRDVSNNISTGRVISAGRLTDVKNHELLIKAFQHVVNKYPSWFLHIYGTGRLKNKLQKLIESMNMNENVFLAGLTDDIGGKYGISDIFALPSLYEGFSRALTEAMNHGLPSVVLSNCISNNYLIRSSGGGILSENNPCDFAQKIMYLIENPHVRKEMGNRAAEYVNAKFQPEKIYTQWEDMLKSIIGPVKA
jgi:glycosyltransferase involved in cell wall biosynthesis